LFQLDGRTREQLFALATTHHCSRNATVFTGDDPADAVFLLLRGRIKVYDLAEDGKELILWFFHSGDLFGIAEASERQRGVSARACEASEILSIPRERFRDFLGQNAVAAWLVIELLGRRLRTLGDVVQNLATTCVTGRVVRLLQRLDATYRTHVDQHAAPGIPVTHQDIADMIGCCRQSVTETLGALRRAGAIECERQSVRVVDPGALRAALPPRA
jgi:CRP-like cAMP-binding protein